MHPFLLEQPAFPAAKQDNKMSGASDEDGLSAAAAAFSTAAVVAAEKATNANALDIAALALTPRSEAAAAAAAAAATARAAAASALLSPAPAATAIAAANAAPPPPPLPPQPPKKVRLRVEARLRASHPAAASPRLRRDLERQLSLLLRDRSWVYADCDAVPLPDGAAPDLLAALETVAVVDTELEAALAPGTVLLFWQVELRVTCYSVSSEPPAVPPALEEDEGGGGGGGPGGAPPYRETVLPHASLEGSLESLALPPGAKARVLRRLGAALALGGAGVNPRLVPSGRLALLLGPPGTGKTSLCRAAAQRLAVRLCFGDNGGGGSASTPSSSRFPGGALLLEVSAPALFSKWFSESGRAVARLFERVASLANDERALVFVLIDEVESLAGSRAGGGGGGGSSSSSGGDPGDAMRAVNALLTGLDALRDSAPGTCVLCTSNLGGLLDAAFVDRADVVLRLGPPPASARYFMLAASVAELSRARVVRGIEVVSTLGGGGREGAAAAAANGQPSGSSSALLPLSLREEDFSSTSVLRLLPPLAARLAEIAIATEGLSGRALRRLPFAALSDAVGLSGLEDASNCSSSSCSSAPAASAPSSAPSVSDSSAGIDALVFMEALVVAAEAERASHGDL